MSSMVHQYFLSTVDFGAHLSFDAGALIRADFRNIENVGSDGIRSKTTVIVGHGGYLQSHISLNFFRCHIAHVSNSHVRG